MSKGTSPWDQLSTDAAQLLLCDLQPEIVARTKTIDRDVLSNRPEYCWRSLNCSLFPQP
jgi:hypothetical protein